MTDSFTHRRFSTENPPSDRNVCTPEASSLLFPASAGVSLTIYLPYPEYRREIVGQQGKLRSGAWVKMLQFRKPRL